ncbi:IPT/TIG domain-containing protein [Actinoplanes sp. DH11]|uniref:IPT/TIG domain-containing protein n=1 Tax=Actinoplanes sp. DH11 TaxID=2857011 RepID=UPI001E304F64|nr:IPT/TIG domain-containing protein [Actinoplanes sp. DH11]
MVGAALLVAPQAAWAATTISPTVVAPGGVVTIADTTANWLDTYVVEVQTAACGVRYTTPSAAAVAVATANRTFSDIPSAGTSPFQQVALTLPSGVTAGTNGQAKRWNVCIYDTTSTTTSTRYGAYAINVGSTPAVTPAANAPTGGGNTVTVTLPTDSPVFTGVTTIGAQFTTTECAATYGTATANLATTATKISETSASLTVPSGVTTATAQPTAYQLCLYNGTTATGALITVAPFEAHLVTPSQPSGTSAGGNALTFTAATPIFAGMTTFGVAFTSLSECPNSYNSTDTPAPATTNVLATAANIRKLSDSQLAVKAPTLTNTSGAASAAVYPFNYRVCIYNGVQNGTSALIASTQYAATTVQTVSGITPSSGPAIGGNRITVSGDDFPTTPGSITATLGGNALTNITPISANAFTATAPAHSPANNVVLVVTTASGQTIRKNAYSYTSSLTAIPNTAPNTSSVDILVRGVGLQAVTWGADRAIDTNAHIYLVDGVYSATDRANPPVAECENVLPFSDTNLVCTLPLATRLDAEGDALFAPAFRAVTGATIDAGSAVITTAADAFTRLDIGMTVVDPDAFGANTATIVDVVNATTAIVSRTASGAVSAGDLDVYPPGARVVTGGVGADTQKVLTKAGAFSASDDGLRVDDFPSTATAIPATTIIDSVAAPNSITLDKDIAVDDPDIVIWNPAAVVPVPEGPYNLTFVSNGSASGTADGDFVQSVISSGSTFTVSRF